MKKVFLLIMPVILTLSFVSCFDGSIFGEDNVKIADETFGKIISAIESNDASKIVELFSDMVKNEGDLPQAAIEFIDYMQGDIISFSSASVSGVGADVYSESGKKRKEINTSFSINTTESTYYIAIKECTIDEFDENNVGVLSIYIVDSNNWPEEYVYRGDGKWLLGINIVNSQQQ